MTVFPAHAGMDRVVGLPHGAHRRVPRTRGDGPADVKLSAPAAEVFPAHAGMDRGSTSPRKSARGVPRTRGDGPLIEAERETCF